MQRKLLTILFACLFVWTARADQEAKGDSIYEQMVEWSLTGKRKEMLANEEQALRYFYDNSQWEHYYYISTLCNANKVLEKGLVMSSLRDCRKLYQFIYTDGLNEAENLELQQFGDDRLLGILQQTPFSSPRHLIDQMTRQVELHRNGAEPNDDLTMLCLCCYA